MSPPIFIPNQFLFQFRLRIFSAKRGSPGKSPGNSFGANIFIIHIWNISYKKKKQLRYYVDEVSRLNIFYLFICCISHSKMFINSRSSSTKITFRISLPRVLRSFRLPVQLTGLPGWQCSRNNRVLNTLCGSMRSRI